MSEFLAEAQVLVRPDTTAFRAELLAQLQAATRGVTAAIPIVAAPIAGSQFAAQSAAVRQTVGQLETLAAAETAAAAASAKAGVVTKRATGTDLGAARAADALAFAKREVLNVTGALAAANVTATRSAAAITAAERFHTAALRAGNDESIRAAELAINLARAQSAEATSALNAARAQATHASSLGFLQRGAGATGLSLLGVRGATLAANASFLAGAAAVVTFAKSVQLAASLEQELNVFRVTAQATADEMDRVSEEARQLGRDVTLPGVSAGDAAEAMTELARAGLSVEESLAGARGVLQLAAAAQISNADATELAAGALNAFGLAGDQAVHVADLLANAANEAQGGIEEMGLALRQSAGVARQVGVSLEDTVAILTLLARNGLQGSDAGTALRTALIRLINPTKEANSVLKQLNVQLRDSQGNIRPEIFADFARATENLSRKQQDAAAAIVFGQDAIRAQAILGREGAASLDEMRAAVERQGAAAELAAARSVGFSGSLSALTSNLETFGSTVGTLALPVLGEFVDILNETVTTANIAADAITDLVEGTTELGGALGDAIPFADRFANALRDALPSNLLELGVPGAGQTISDLADRFSRGADQIKGDSRDAARDVEALFLEFQNAGGGMTALNLLVVALDEMADKLGAGDAEAQRLAQEIRGIVREIQEVSHLPPTVLDVEARFEKDQIVNTAKGASKELIDGLIRAGELGFPDLRDLGVDMIGALEEGLQEGVEKIKLDTRGPVQRILGQISGLEEQLVEAQIADDRGRQLEILRREEERLEAILARPGLSVETRRETKQKLLAVTKQIQAIEDDIASDAKQHAEDVRRARREADDAFLRSIGLEEARLQRRVLLASLDETLRNDIATNIDLRNFYRRQIEEAERTIKDAQRRVEVIERLKDDIARTTKIIEELRDDVTRSIEEDRQNAIEERERALELNIEFAEITGNRRAEIRAREALIRDLEARIDDVEEGTNRYRELRNAIARQREAIDDLKGETEDRGRAFRELTFAFLQQQQGFAATLLGNLLPAEATVGTVGGAGAPTPRVAPPGPAREVAAAGAVAGAGVGVSQGQFSVLIDLTRQMLDVLRGVTRAGEHPEARHQRAVGSANMDIL